MGERIKELRMALGLTQQEFADRVGTTRNNIAGYETGRRLPSEAVINLIVVKLNVSESWIRTGEGDMLIESDDSILAQLAKQYNMDSFEKALVASFLKMQPEQRKAIQQYVKLLIAETGGNKTTEPTRTPPPVETMPDLTPDLVKEVAELKRQNQELAAEIAAMKEEDAEREKNRKLMKELDQKVFQIPS